MKKMILLTISVFAFMMTAKAQNVWTGTTTPTTTLGNAGIGTITPDSKLTIRTSGPLYNSGTNSYDYTPALNIYQESAIAGGRSLNMFSINLRSAVGPGYGTLFSVSPDQTHISNKVRIGNTAAIAPYNNYALSVDGDIIAKKIVVQTSNWADFVFSDDYTLKPLEEVEEFIKENKHLPDVPSEATVLREGTDVAEMNRILLQKVEELTLYVIDIKKENEVLKKKVESITNKIK